MRSRCWFRWAMSSVVAAASLIGGCGGSFSKHNHSQVVARVNNQDVTVLQLNQLLQSSGVESPTPQVIHAAIDSLVDEELLVQQAMKSQLNRDPAIVQALEQARRRLLAQAYAERMLYPKDPIPLAQEEAYYRNNPALFENRKLYRLTAITVQSADLTDRLIAEFDNTHSGGEVRDVLEKHAIRFETQQLDSAAEDLPLDKLNQFAKADVGDLIIAAQRDGKTILMSVVSAEERPLSFERAKPMIERHLMMARNAEATKTYLKHVKETAKISYSPQYNAGTPQPAAAPHNEQQHVGDASISMANSHAQSGAAELN
jgi:peptidyl-prolyl cis-trans isomerase C